MTWRRFSTLLRGLGPNSASASRAVVRRYQHGKHQDVRTIDGSKEQVSAAFVAQFGGIARKNPGGKAGKRPAGG